MVSARARNVRQGGIHQSQLCPTFPQEGHRYLGLPTQASVRGMPPCLSPCTALCTRRVTCQVPLKCSGPEDRRNYLPRQIVCTSEAYMDIYLCIIASRSTHRCQASRLDSHTWLNRRPQTATSCGDTASKTVVPYKRCSIQKSWDDQPNERIS